jgi:hypothetical protein
MSESLHKVRGGIDLAMDVIGRAVVAHRPDGTIASEKILEGLCLAARELAFVAELVDAELRALPVGQKV